MNLHAQIMNLPASGEPAGGSMAYKLGHRDARHAAAEVALSADSCIEALRQLLAAEGRFSGGVWDKAHAALAKFDKDRA